MRLHKPHVKKIKMEHLYCGTEMYLHAINWRKAVTEQLVIDPIKMADIQL